VLGKAMAIAAGDTISIYDRGKYLLEAFGSFVSGSAVIPGIAAVNHGLY